MDNLFTSFYKIQQTYPNKIETNRLILQKQNNTDLNAVEFFIALKETKEIIGIVVMLVDGEIWYKIYKPFRNKGFATEAVSKLIDISKRNNFHLTISFRNKPSIKLARKLGFTYQERCLYLLTFVKEK